MTKTPLAIRTTTAALAIALTAGILGLAHWATYTGPAGLPVVELERVVVTPVLGQLAEVSVKARMH